MNVITLGEAKEYLRVDSSMDDNLILGLLAASEKLVVDVARISAEEWAAVFNGDESPVSVRGTTVSPAELLQLRDLLRTGVLYALGFLYEHREEANHRSLVMTLRNLLSSVREGVF